MLLSQKKININVLFSILCGIWLFALLFLRKWHIFGPVSFRNFAGVIIVPLAFFMRGHIKITKTIKLYILWNILYVIVNMINGMNVLLTNDYLAYNIVSFCIIYAIPKLIRNENHLYIITIWFFIFYILNSVVSILQFVNNPVAWAISTYISPLTENDLLQYSYYEDAENFLTQSICSGFNGFVVTNGYFIACFLPIATILLWQKKKISINLGILVLLLGMASAFCTQQRMCFLLCALYIVYIIYYRVSAGYKAFLFFIGLLFILIYSNSFLFESSSYGRLLSMNANGRSQTWEMTSMFFTNTHYFFMGNVGGNINAQEMVRTLGHNCFLDALRRGGFFSLIIYIVMFLVVMFELKNVILDSKKRGNLFALCFAMAALFNILYSFTHSENIINGSIFFWLSYTLMLTSLNINANNRRYIVQ